MKHTLEALLNHEKLGYAEAREVLTALTQNAFNASQTASFITVFLMRGVTVEELAGFRDALLDLCLKVDLGSNEFIDLCGTGGDGKNTFNISTTASFIVAGAGYKVAKHGNYGVSSVSGSSNVLEYLGYSFSADAAKLAAELDKAGICFMHAPLFHPAMKSVAPVRKELGIKTFFNMLGPMVNPAFPRYQLTGVFNLELARLYHYIYQRGTTEYAVIHNLDGYDECSLTAPLKRYSRKDEKVLYPEDFGFDRIDADAITGGRDTAANAQIFLDLLQNKGEKAAEQVVIANAALAIDTISHKGLMQSVEEATESLHSGNAYKAFTQLITMQP
ncbi:MAG TPA: anthranilate phosphoribosyltransferase [Bacteroidales bacterium]|nr:anthranilate phosphoribosyltransferase [Bacteroidales bacterium]